MSEPPALAIISFPGEPKDNDDMRWLWKAFRAFIIACRWVLNLPILRQFVNLVGMGIFMTTLLIGWSALTIFAMDHFTPGEWIPHITFSIYLAMPYIALVVHVFNPSVVSFLFSTLAMCSIACSSTVVRVMAPELHERWNISFALIALPLSVAYYGQCNMQDIQMNIPIASVSFFPLLISVWTFILEPAIRMVLLMPTLVYSIYPVAAFLSRKFGRNADNDVSNHWLMIGASLSISVIAMSMGGEVAIESAGNFLFLICGLATVFIGGCAYNISIVVLKLKSLNRETFDFEFLSEKEKKGHTNGFVIVLILMCGDILGLCLSSSREAQTIFFSIFIGLYIVLPFFYLPVKGYHFKLIHCILMLSFFTAALIFVIFAEKPYLPALSATNSSSWFPFGSVPIEYQVEGAWLCAIACALLFIYFTMTALVQADLSSEHKLAEGEMAEWLLEELEIIPAKPAIEKDKY